MPRSTRTYHLVTAALFGAIALLQGVRAALGMPIAIGEFGMPIGASLGVAGVAAALAVWGWRTR